jgi:hypothetical protein
VVEVQERWLGLLTQCLLDAGGKREIASYADVAQAVFEIEAMLLAANSQFVMMSNSMPLTQARSGVENVLAWLRRHE